MLEVPMVCPNCFAQLVKEQDEYGMYLVCWANLHWVGHIIRGCAWVGNPEELFHDHGFTRFIEEMP